MTHILCVAVLFGTSGGREEGALDAYLLVSTSDRSVGSQQGAGGVSLGEVWTCGDLLHVRLESASVLVELRLVQRSPRCVQSRMFRHVP